jgi:hypothetical protein
MTAKRLPSLKEFEEECAKWDNTPALGSRWFRTGRASEGMIVDPWKSTGEAWHLCNRIEDEVRPSYYGWRQWLWNGGEALLASPRPLPAWYAFWNARGMWLVQAVGWGLVLRAIVLGMTTR